MKHLLLVISFLLPSLALQAQTVSRKQGLKAAQSFVAQEGIRMQIKAMPYEFLAPDQSAPQLYVYEDTDGKGFVIVSASENTEAILGYSVTEAFDSENIPTSLQGWLEGMSRQVQLATAKGFAPHRASYTNPAIEPMLTTRWNQDAPYNLYAPEVSNQRCPTGCLATAMAQIMYYHRWPVGQTTAIRSYTTSTYHISRPALPATTFDWDAMQNSYSYTATNGEPVAKLMNYLGQAVQMDFAPGGSGASHSYVSSALRNYFGYTSTMKVIEHSGYSISQWDDLVYNELKNNRPVLYVGYTPNWEGHAFVCDGYDGKGFYHINWGWGGVSDGYFRLSVLNPGNTTSSGAASTDDGFTNGQAIVAGIQADGPDNILELWPLKSLSYNSSTKRVSATITAISSGTYEVTLANRADDGTLTEMFAPVQRQFMNNSNYTYDFNLNELSDGSYNLYAVLRKKGEPEWIRVGSRSQFAEVNVGGAVSVVMHPIVDFEVTNVYFPNSVVAGRNARLNIDVKNNADEYTNDVYVYTGENDVLTTNCGSISVAMLSGEEFTVSTNITPAVTKNLTVGVTSDKAGKNVLFKRTYYNYLLTIDSSVITWDPLVVTIRLKNDTPIPYNRPIYATFYQEGVKKALGTLNQDADIPANGVGEVSFNLALAKDKKYYATLQFQQNELTSTKKNIDGQVDIFYDESAGIDNLTVLPAATTIYNTAGQRVGSDYRGIVIVNGRRVLQK